MSQNPSPDQDGEVRLSEYAGRVIRNWYVVLITVVVAVLLVVLHTVGTGKQSQAQATVFLGTPLTPIGGSVQLNSVVANPTSAQAYLHTGSVLDAAAAKAGIKSGAALRNHLSVTALQNTSTKSTGATPNMQVTVQGPYDRTSALAAVQSLGDSLIAWANKYQTAKIDALTAQIATDKASIATLQQALTTAQNQLKALAGSGMSSTDKATVSAALLSTISDTGSRIDEISTAADPEPDVPGQRQGRGGGRIRADPIRRPRHRDQPQEQADRGHLRGPGRGRDPRAPVGLRSPPPAQDRTGGRAMSTRSCPEWPELLDRAPDLHFKHYTADELQLAADIVVALGPGVRLSEIEVCADTQRNVFYAAHTDPRLADALSGSYWQELDSWTGETGSP